MRDKGNTGSKRRDRQLLLAKYLDVCRIFLCEFFQFVSDFIVSMILIEPI